MGRAPCCEKVGLKKGPWTPEEDQKLLDYIKEHGHGSWRSLPLKAGLLRCGKSCRLRWTNYLRPDIKRGKFSSSEEQSIIQLHALLGNRWSAIASYLPQRTDNEVKNYWNTHLKKRLMRMGLDPKTHNLNSDIMIDKININNTSNDNKPGAESLLAGGGFSSLSHNAQWECARREAEARLASRDCHMPALDWFRLDSYWQKSLQGQAAKMWPPSGHSGFILAESQQKSGDNQWEEFLSQPIACDEISSLPVKSSDPSSPSEMDEEVGSRLPAISSSCCSSSYSPASPALNGEVGNDEWVSILEHLMDTPLTPTSSLYFIGSSQHQEEDQDTYLF